MTSLIHRQSIRFIEYRGHRPPFCSNQSDMSSFLVSQINFSCSPFHDIVNNEHQKWSNFWKVRTRFTHVGIKNDVNSATSHPEIMILRLRRPTNSWVMQNCRRKNRSNMIEGVRQSNSLKIRISITMEELRVGLVICWFEDENCQYWFRSWFESW